MVESKDLVEDHLSSLDASGDEDQFGRSTNRNGEASEQNGEEERITLGNEQRRARRKSQERSRNDDDSVEQGDSDISEGEIEEPEGSSGNALRPSGQASKRIGQHAKGRTQAGVPPSRNLRAESVHTTQDDRVDQGRCGKKALRRSPDGIPGSRRGCRNGGATSGPPPKVNEPATRLQPSLFKWAANVVTGLGRQ